MLKFLKINQQGVEMKCKQVILCGVLSVFLATTGHSQIVAVTACLSSDIMYTAFNDAVWPADAVKLGKVFQGCHPDKVSSEMVDRIEIMKASQAVIRKTSLFPEGFFAAKQEYLRLAGLGDSDAALKAAESCKEGSRRIAWLEYAALLGNARAAKSLTNHYSTLGQTNEAAKWLKLAVEQGAQMPATFDNVRK